MQSVEADAAVFLEPPIPGSTNASSSLQPQATGSAALTNYGDGSAGSGETLPWGVRAVWQGDDISARGNFASDTYAFVIDSGVLSSTGDLNLAGTNSWHRSWVSGETAFTDGNGHGSHVAGTIAALANGKGVVGVAPGAQVVSLKVFDSSGGGASYSSIIDAINHAVAVINNNGLDKKKVVINMSLGGGFSSSLDTAVKNAASQGIRLAVAAGNSGKDADNYSPAAAGDHPNVFTISAVDSQYRMASWSNWDQVTGRDKVDDVDLAAPGVSVLSYYRNGQLAYLSGTSMAAPHVAGLLLAGGVQAGPWSLLITQARPIPSRWASPQAAIQSHQQRIPSQSQSPNPVPIRSSGEPPATTPSRAASVTIVSPVCWLAAPQQMRWGPVRSTFSPAAPEPMCSCWATAAACSTTTAAAEILAQPTMPGSRISPQEKTSSSCATPTTSSPYRAAISPSTGISTAMASSTRAVATAMS
ncbi:MAG: S8 family serine peptidase [Cyanobium sp. M30B3]|nr:MAG: S8 family serine peptidase [Cyanobium sp. M30B3]